jgi:hypothetical protein
MVAFLSIRILSENQGLKGTSVIQDSTDTLACPVFDFQNQNTSPRRLPYRKPLTTCEHSTQDHGLPIAYI